MATGKNFRYANFQIHQNSKQHHTDVYRHSKLIVRRGQPFTCTLFFKHGGFQDETNQMTFIAETGSNQRKFSISQNEPAYAWGAVVNDTSPQTLEITFFTPSFAIVGRYSLMVQFSKEEQPIKCGEFILLFNPWKPGDTVFLSKEEEIQEYVMNDYGIIFQGTQNYIQSIGWNYGQFEANILDICLEILDHSLDFLGDPDSDYSRRGDPAHVSRVISAMVNANDDNGVVEGKWEGEYANGKKPTDWNGSVAILRQWQANGFQAVKYGQCWVFAGVLCTVMRCLGIPTRVVTNFESAHDANEDLVIDQVFDKNGKLLKAESNDSIWNFHVWNECWMRRRDLSSGYDGWQVVDATPQEQSNGVYCCGPTSVKAVKRALFSAKFDCTFVYAEVNATINSWVLKAEKKEKVNSVRNAVGKNISTKSISGNERIDITDTYK
ncbi:protein-glutamine gamma-glutamyltransferase 5-like [Rhinatrema bivittatum]|uniref:protein-glutamine gamma-glutamyltransferase 5-like n=1 Tax=Rhinatrema bivittatum TaxID=194408 RepID=UPI001126B0E5|nr:protein-glutamine gamma-glutamyltransferase 5-like [Rhinatrema bivittatum]